MSAERWIKKQVKRQEVKRRKITLRYLINEINKDLRELGEKEIDLNFYKKKYKCIEKMLEEEKKNDK